NRISALRGGRTIAGADDPCCDRGAVAGVPARRSGLYVLEGTKARHARRSVRADLGFGAGGDAADSADVSAALPIVALAGGVSAPAQCAADENCVQVFICAGGGADGVVVAAGSRASGRVVLHGPRTAILGSALVDDRGVSGAGDCLSRVDGMGRVRVQKQVYGVNPSQFESGLRKKG